MFEGFETRMLPGRGAEINCRIGGEGPPLLLIHGYPQTGAMWATVAERLASRFQLVVPDLRGYGRSEKVRSTGGEGYTKRRMAADLVEVMEGLGHRRFAVAGHDRGARVAYRMALDDPDRVDRLAVLDIVPTLEMWEAITAESARSAYHWQFLARPEPLPERLIGADAVFFFDTTLASWTAERSLSAFSPEALAEYRAAFVATGAIHATCEDYRAGATLDPADDRADRDAGRQIEAPTLALWGAKGSPASTLDVLAVWRRWCREVDGVEVPGGHFVVEEAPEETFDALERFLLADRNAG